MSVAGEEVMQDLALSPVQFGAVLAAFAWGYAAFQFPAGIVGDRVGARRTLAVVAVAWGVLNCLVGLVPGPPIASPMLALAALILLRALMGVAQAPLYPVTGGAMTCEWFPVTGWAFPNGLTNAGLTLGSAATGPLIAWLMTRAGWRGSFLITAPLALLLALVWWIYTRDTPAEHPAVRQEELALIATGRSTAAAGRAPDGAWKAVIRDPQVLLLAASYFCSNYVFYFFFNWLFIYLVENRGLRALEGGLYAAVPWIAGAAGALAGGIASDRLSKAYGMRWGCRLPSMLGLGMAGIAILAAARAAGPVLAVILLAVCLGFQQMTEGAFWAATIAVSGRNASSACGVLNTGGNVVGGVGALLIPLTVHQLGWGAALASGSLFAFVGMLLWCWIRADRSLGPGG